MVPRGGTGRGACCGGGGLGCRSKVMARQSTSIRQPVLSPTCLRFAAMDDLGASAAGLLSSSTQIMEWQEKPYWLLEMLLDNSGEPIHRQVIDNELIPILMKIMKKKGIFLKPAPSEHLPSTAYQRIL